MRKRVPWLVAIATMLFAAPAAAWISAPDPSAGPGSGQNCPSWGPYRAHPVEGAQVRTGGIELRWRWCDSYDRDTVVLQIQWRSVGGEVAGVPYRAFLLPRTDSDCPARNQSIEDDPVSKMVSGRLRLRPGDEHRATAMHVPRSEMRRRHLRICYFDR